MVLFKSGYFKIPTADELLIEYQKRLPKNYYQKRFNITESKCINEYWYHNDTTKLPLFVRFYRRSDDVAKEYPHAFTYQVDRFYEKGWEGYNGTNIVIIHADDSLTLIHFMRNALKVTDKRIKFNIIVIVTSIDKEKILHDSIRLPRDPEEFYLIYIYPLLDIIYSF